MHYRNIQHYLYNGLDSHTQNIPCPKNFFQILRLDLSFTMTKFSVTEEHRSCSLSESSLLK
jgi:hypothetical protein